MSSCCEIQKSSCYSGISYIKGQDMNRGKEYAQRLLSLLEEKIIPGPQTFGFEYEFISRTPLNLDIMQRIYAFLPETGFIRHNSSFIHESGMYIDFEPGGQIEFHSPPLTEGENDRLNNCLTLIKEVIGQIKLQLGIEYIARAYIPDRKDSPLCLDAERYINLHDRLTVSGTRGLEMMKGTASIHFHAGIKNIEDFPVLFAKLIRISQMDDFQMGKDRRTIWDNTDSVRCGQPFGVDDNDSPLEMIEKIVTHAFRAEHIGENRPFIETLDTSFDSFMYHLTTIFTDIRLNIKGPSIELRTIDSVPFDQFKMKWNRFILLINNKMQSHTGI